MLGQMRDATSVYGFSRGYRILATVSLGACVLSALVMVRRSGLPAVPVAGVAGFFLLFLYAWSRSAKRIPVMQIVEKGFVILDPALTLGLVEFSEIQELRIFATLENPMVALQLEHPDQVRRRAPTILRWLLKPVWLFRHYHVVVQLDHLNDQVAAIKSTALKAGIPVTSELI